MIITVDGYDGTGKTTLAKKIAERFDFIYVEKPFIHMIKEQQGCTYEEAKKIAEQQEAIIWQKPRDLRRITKYYLDAFIWLKKYQQEYNIIMDRGLLTTYAVVGEQTTEDLFDFYVDMGCFFDGSIYLTADDYERVRRIYNNDPNDPDLKYPVKWRENNLEEYAQTRGLNYHPISTDHKTADEVFEEAIPIVERLITPDLPTLVKRPEPIKKRLFE